MFKVGTSPGVFNIALIETPILVVPVILAKCYLILLIRNAQTKISMFYFYTKSKSAHLLLIKLLFPIKGGGGDVFKMGVSSQWYHFITYFHHFYQHSTKKVANFISNM